MESFVKQAVRSSNTDRSVKLLFRTELRTVHNSKFSSVNLYMLRPFNFPMNFYIYMEGTCGEIPGYINIFFDTDMPLQSNVLL